ncbi:MAG: hypothetical protein FWD28_11070, partial [Treponema sp.]|nr:hypothetical protein [Treponema sp.]
GSNLAENYRDEYRIKWNGILAKHNINGRITDPFSNNFESNILLFPIDNFNVWFDYLYNPYDAEIGEFPYGYIDYKVIIGNGNNQNIAAERRIANYGNFDGKKILGYYRSPYQNRIIIVAYNYYTYYHGPGGYLTLYGFNLGLLN